MISKEQIDIIETLFNSIKLPPHYPERRYEISEQVIIDLLNQLSLIVDEIGFKDANIGIKNIISKVISTFVISSYYQNWFAFFVSCSNNILTIYGGDNYLLLKYDNSDIYLQTESKEIKCARYSINKYTNYSCKHNKNNPDQFLQQFTYAYSTNIYDSLFLQEGIEVNRKFVLQNNNERKKDYTKLSGIFRRFDDFFTVGFEGNYKKEINGEKNEFSLNEILLPFLEINEINFDLNLLPEFPIRFQMNNFEKISALFEEPSDYIQSVKEFWTDKIIQDEKNCLFDNDTTDYSLLLEGHSQPILFGPYSKEIMYNMRRLFSGRNI